MSAHKTASGHLNPAAAPGPKTLSWSRRAPGTAAPGPFRCFCPVSSSAVPAAALGRLPRAGRALWGLLAGISGHLVVSPSAWEVWGQQDEPEMSQPCQRRKQQGCGEPQDPGVGAGDHSLCHSMPAHASGPGSLLLMLSPPTIHPFPLIPCSQPIKAAFCSTSTPLGPQEGPQGGTTLRAPHNPGVGGTFPASPTSAEGQGCSSVSFPAVGFLSGELRAGFAPTDGRGWGWRLPEAGNHIPAPTQASDRVGKRPPAGNMRSRGTLLAQTQGQGD